VETDLFTQFPGLPRRASGPDRPIRFVALGDSATCGVGDRADDGSWRGWARILADAISESHDLSFFNLAVSGATTRDVRRSQLPAALAHRPHIAALIVGLNDTMCSSWDVRQVRENLLACAGALCESGALLMTVRFHDHARVLRLPGGLSRLLSRRIEALNGIFDEVHTMHDGLNVDLSKLTGVYDRRLWWFDRLHPSELGHRVLAHRFAEILGDRGLAFTEPQLACSRPAGHLVADLGWILGGVIPWLARRGRELGTATAVSSGRRFMEAVTLRPSNAEGRPQRTAHLG
jgi:lysophospholipase L1-like esterase